jgi:hypothetical protein
MDTFTLEKMAESADTLYECLEAIHEDPTIVNNEALTLELRLHARFLKGKIEELVASRTFPKTIETTTGREL